MRKTVLTVDDSRTMREMLLLALQDAGYHVLQAEDGLKGLEVLKDRPAERVLALLGHGREHPAVALDDEAREPALGVGLGLPG